MSNGYKILKVKKAGKIPGVKIGPESGIDLRYIQKLLGQKSSKTVEIYTDVSTSNFFALEAHFIAF